MKTKHLLIAFILIVALFLVGCGSKQTTSFVVPVGAQAGDLVDLQPCTYKAGETEYAADCGTLVVPENSNDPGSRLIALPVIRAHALGDNLANPIFFFQGGPGSSNLHFQHLEGLVDGHDFVQVGYRGADGSVVFDCPEIEDVIRNPPRILSETAVADYREASSQCSARLKAEGVDMAGYTMTEVINDMEAARVALGYERINLLGESYGTRVETIYERMYPDSLNRVVMVAVNPPGHFVWDPNVVDAQIEDYAKLCAKDPDCSARTDDLAASIRNVSQNMPDHWLFMRIDPDMVKFMAFLMFMESATPSDSPVQFSGPAAIDMWLAAEKGDPSGMAILSILGKMIAPNSFIFGDLLAKASSGGDFIDPAVNARERLDPSNSIIGSPMSLLYSGMIDGWSKYLVPEEYWQMQSTDVETLLVSGSIDFSTPPQFATHELLPYLTNGRQVILKDFGHSGTFWSSQPEARSHMLNTFFDTGEFDDSLYKYQPVNFNVGRGMPGLAKLALGIVVAIIVVLVALVWAVVRRIRSRRTSRN